MSVRHRRLQADYEQIKQGLRGHPAIRIRGVSGSPPERYQIDFNLRGLVETAEGTITERHEHVAEIYLTLSYPRQAPQCRMLTPVFHPNIAPHAVCIGDHWAAGESLLSLIVRIGEMLAFQSYNTKSPLNGAAARWVDENGELLPSDPRDLSPRTPGTAGTAAPTDKQCRNCHAADQPLSKCTGGHLVCDDCLVECGRCRKTFCVLCSLESCPQCGRLVCDECRTKCPQCGQTTCREHLRKCAICGEIGCPDCDIECSQCGIIVCLAHIRQCTVCRTPVCIEHARTCPGCGKSLCAEHVKTCRVCGKDGCPECIFECSVCGKYICVEHVTQCSTCRCVLCAEHRLTCTQCGRTVCSQHLDGRTRLCARCREGNGAFQSS